ncbi:ABC transporter permease [Aeropyrum camini]|uniref:ABC transporter permease n=1 Tax=Aeropyrum camini SY1 = JCM 12091 TaxID=1198449 RepID=U3TEF9_9CREN|nr:ABC transporter permease [Aeropyrum camini]BAN90348.1 ABC transporter permease [Aeropyrum camini SY1 = JCM 12091]
MSNLTRFLVRRILTFIPTLVGVTFVTFLIATVVPGNPAKLWAGGEKASPEVVEQIVKEYRLDRPFWEQYFFFMYKLLTNTMISPVTSNYVWDMIVDRLPVTIQLTLLAFVFIIILGIPLGIISALTRDTIVDAVIRIMALVGISVPIFWLAYLLIFVFYTKYRLITLAGTPEPPYSITGIPLIDSIIMLDMATFEDVLRRYTIPAFTLAYPSIGFVARLVRNSFLDAMSGDYVEFMDARGLPSTWKYRHILRNSSIPIVTVLGLIFGGLLTGAPITETIFGLPGLGKFLLDSINNYDYLSLMGGVLFVGIIYLTVNLLVDITYAIIDPRVRY